MIVKAIRQPSPAIAKMDRLPRLLARFCLLAMAILNPGASSKAAPVITNRVAATVLTVEGKVEVLRAGATQPQPAVTNLTLGFGDTLHTGPRSRATVRLSDLSVIRVNEKTVLEIRAQADAKGSLLDLKSGSSYFFNRAKPSSIQFHTPLISGAIRGTEFNLSAEDNGPTTVTLIEGEIAMSNDKGELVLKSGEQGTANPGEAPRKTAMLDAINIIQWSLYYPAVLDPDELGLTPGEKSALADSLMAYRSGDLLAALDDYPPGRQPDTDAERVLHSGLLLAVGQVTQTEAGLRELQTASPSAEALREVIAAVKHEDFNSSPAPKTAGQWLAESYYLQSRSKLKDALKAAQEAVSKSPNFGFAWVRVAELKFGLGDVEGAKTALERGLELSPRNAQALTLKGFILAAQNRTQEAASYFDQAIAVDGALANAWLGRGLCKIRRGQSEAGRADLQVAATLEPNRSELRSYLGKAWDQVGDRKHAEKELRLARQLDPNDPTPWLYSSLLNYAYNRNNEAVGDLEKSKELNDNRSVFRSKQLLDQDQAVRGANLAQIYRDEGMDEWSVKEAAQAVDNDYANYSAHLFLAESYDALRDPKQINLRYETPWFSQLLVSDLLAPVGSVSLSQNVSQQEYSRMFDGNHFGAINDTIYSSRGDWLQNASQYGNVGNSAFSFDEYYLKQNGFRPNNDLQDFNFTPKFKQQLTEQDSIFFEASLDSYHSGDVRQYYDQSMASPTLRVSEAQDNFYLGYHRQWAEGINTLALVGRLEDRFSYDDPASLTHLVTTTPTGIVTGVNTIALPFDFYSELEAYTAELQQIFQTDKQTLVFGARYQTGSLDNTSTLVDTRQLIFPTFSPLVFSQGITPVLKRANGYAYYTLQPVKSLLLTAGVSYDHLEYPRNDEIAPVTSDLESKNQLSPKAGFRWMPFDKTTLRGAYTRSLGGVFYDTSVRLEPTEIAGFNQAYRSILPESVVGLVPGTRFETYDLAIDQELPSRTYFTMVAELLKSTGEQGQGYLAHSGPIATDAAQLDDRYNYTDESLSFIANQLLGDEFTVGASYRIDVSQLTDQVPAIPSGPLSAAFSPTANSTVRGTLQSVHVYGLFNHPCGFFAKAEMVWFAQSNVGYAVNLPGDDFAQANAFAGYRFPRRHAELQVGVLDINDRDYKLNPLNLYNELPRERTFVAEAKFSF